MSEHEHEHEVKIFIDQHTYHSPNPTTGTALYALSEVGPGLELFREVAGDHEDPEVDNGPEIVHLKADEHFHSGPPKVYKIIVNGRKKEVTTKTLTFDHVVALAFNPVPVGPTVQFSVTYRKGPRRNHEGTLTEGETVRVKDGMIFDVTETNKS
ncbi:MAG: multiubiquitin domain-containing protein [Acidobacteriaceae bacterium]